MSPSEFLTAADRALNTIEDAISAIADGSDLDIEAERSGNVLTITIDASSKVIVNLQEPMQEIWLAARAGGFHFRQQGGAWIDTRDQTELFAALSKRLSEQAGRPLIVRG